MDCANLLFQTQKNYIKIIVIETVTLNPFSPHFMVELSPNQLGVFPQPKG